MFDFSMGSYDVEGWIGDNQAVIEHVYPQAFPVLQCEGSEQSHHLFVEVIGESGQTVRCKIHIANPPCEIPGSECPKEEKESFEVSMPYIASPVEYRLVDTKTGEIHYSHKLSGSAPTVAFSVLPQGTLSNNLQAAWTGQDADGDHLTYSLWYTAGDSDPVSWDLVDYWGDKTQASVPLVQLPGGTTTSRILVMVSDGFHGGFAESPSFVLPSRVPHINFVYPEPNSVLQTGNKELFYVYLNENEYADKLPVENITWSSSKDGVFGHGWRFEYNGLSSGIHTITVTVNTPGGTSTKIVENIIVAKKKPKIVLTVGDGVQPGLACNELKIDVVPGDVALKEVRWYGIAGIMRVVEHDKLPIHYLLPNKPVYVVVKAVDLAGLYDDMDLMINPNICPPPTPLSGG